MTLLERYIVEDTWHGRVLIMEIYHLAMSSQSHWTIRKTAEYFDVSIGLVSENLKLANAIHDNDKILQIETRTEALRKLHS